MSKTNKTPMSRRLLGDERGRSPVSPGYWARRAAEAWKKRPASGRPSRKPLRPAPG